MAIQVTAINGMGSYTINGSNITAQGMKDNDIMHVSEDYVGNAGVVNLAGDLLVTQNSPTGASVLVGAGTCYVLNRNYTANQNVQSKYWRMINDASVTVNIASNNSGNPRVDSIFIRVNPSTSPGNNGELSATIGVLQGTPAPSPVAPSIPNDGNSYLILANVAVANGFTSITNANITDRRVPALFQSNQDGTIRLPGTYTRVSATVIGCPTGLDPRTFLSIGDKLRYTESVTQTVKYAYVIGLTATQITITSGTSFGGGIAASNVPTDIMYSKGTMVGFPSFFSYEPTISAVGGMTVSSVAYEERNFKIIERTVYFKVRASMTLGGTPSNGIRITTPTTVPASGNVDLLHGNCGHNDGGLLAGLCVQDYSNSRVQINKADSSNYSLGSGRRVYVQDFYNI
jgi:hypothetical protein